MGLFVFLLWTGLVHVAEGAQNCTDLLVFDGDIQKRDVQCTEYTGFACHNGPFGNLVHGLGEGQSVDQPREFRAEPVRRRITIDNTNYSVPGLSYTWKAPASGLSRSNIKGFLLKMQTVGSGEVICRLFDLRNFSMTTSASWKFYYTLFPRYDPPPPWKWERPITYLVDLFSLPPPTYQEFKTGLYAARAISLQPARNLDRTPVVYPKEWTTWVTAKPYPTESTIEVEFGLPEEGSEADKAKFELYDIQLVNGSPPPRVVAKTEYNSTFSSGDSGVYNFTGLQSGRYYVKVRPIDAHFNDKGRCQCWTPGNFGGKDCGTCQSSRTNYFNFTVVDIPTTTSPSVTSDDQSQALKVEMLLPAVIVPGVLLMLVAMVSLMASVYCWRIPIGERADHKDRDIFRKVEIFLPSRARELKVPQISRKTVMLLASEDHTYFSQVLHNFSSFLKLHCQCDVMFASEQLDDVRKTANSYCWLSGKIDKADFVIIVASEAAFHLYQAFQNGQVYKEADFGPEGDLFTPGIKHICGKIASGEDVSKVMMVRFAHTLTNHRLPISALPPCFYLLPNRLKSFLLHIHGLDEHTMDLSKVNLPLKGNVKKLQGGGEWLNAVSESMAFQREHPGWFQEKFGRPVDMGDKDRPSFVKQFSVLSQESGFFEERYSGSLQRQLSSVSSLVERASLGFVPDGLENPSFVLSKSDFFAPSMFEAQSAYTVPYSSYTAAESPLEVERGSTINDEFRMMNERYEQDRLQELHQQQEPESNPEEERSDPPAGGDQNAFQHEPQDMEGSQPELYGVDTEHHEGEADLECISISSAESV